MRVEGSGFRVQGSGFRVQGSEFRVQGSGFRAQGPGFRIEDNRQHADAGDVTFRGPRSKNGIYVEQIWHI